MSASFLFRGFVLGQQEIHESDILVSLLTEKKGKLLVKAKGVRNIKSKRQGILQTGNLIHGRIFSRQGFYVMGDVEASFQPLTIRRSLVGCGMLLSMAELLAKFLPEEEENRQVYLLFWETLLRLCQKIEVETMINFEVKLLQLLGYGLPSEAWKQLKKKNWKMAQTEIWRYFNAISDGNLVGLGNILK